MTFSFIDLFAGIGGMRLAFEEAGGRCLFSSEWNRYSRQTYCANFNADDGEIWGDITTKDAKKIDNHDVLLAGFPCQPFSIAGVSKKNALGRQHGFADETQGTLFFDVARILEACEPRAFLLENVKNLQSHDGGRTLDVIRYVLEEQLGYDVSMRVIDARSFVPQHRERLFIVGTRRGSPPFSLSEVDIPDPSSGPRLASILHPEDGSERSDGRCTVDPDGRVDPKYTLSPRLWEYLQAYAEKHRAAGNGFGFGLVRPDGISRTLSARYYKDGSEILVEQPGARPRRLTPREAARLMGFDTARFPRHRALYGDRPWQIPVSDTQAYRQFGNAVVPDVAARIAQALTQRMFAGTAPSASRSHGEQSGAASGVCGARVAVPGPSIGRESLAR